MEYVNAKCFVKKSQLQMKNDYKTVTYVIYGNKIVVDLWNKLTNAYYINTSVNVKNMPFAIYRSKQVCSEIFEA